MPRRSPWMQRAPVAGGVVLVVALVCCLVWMIHGFMAHKDQKPPRNVQNITVIRPPPPPPEEPPPPPPPEKIDEPIPQNEPEPTPDNTPAPPQQLGLDAEGGAGDDAFGLAARKGGSDLVGTGGAVFAWYQKKMESAINDRLAADECLRSKKYVVELRIRVNGDGRLAVEEMLKGSGDRRIDGCISADLSSDAVRVDEAPPLEFPRVASVRIVQRS